MTPRSFGQLLGGYGQRKSRGSDVAPTDPVRAYSYDIDDARARPGSQIGDGSKQEGWAFKQAQRGAAKWLYEHQRDSDYSGAYRIQAMYLHIYEVMLDEFLFVANGDFSPSYAAIAKVSKESESTVKRAVRALEHWGFLAHVRRSVKIDAAAGMAGPRRKQASNAYYFDCEARMEPDLWQVFWRKLVLNLKRCRQLAARAAAVIKRAFNSTAKPAPRAAHIELQATLERLGAAVGRHEAAGADGSLRPAAGALSGSESPN